LQHLEDSPTTTFSLGVEPLLTDEEMASILEWLRTGSAHMQWISRASSRLGMYYRFHPRLVRDWLGSLDPLMRAEAVATYFLTGHLNFK
jgi:hypothetical protein